MYVIHDTCGNVIFSTGNDGVVLVDDQYAISYLSQWLPTLSDYFSFECTIRIGHIAFSVRLLETLPNA